VAEIDAAPVYGPRIEPIATSYNGRPTGEPSAERWGKLPLKGGKTTGELFRLKSARFPLPGETVEKSIFALLSNLLSPGIISLNPNWRRSFGLFLPFSTAPTTAEDFF
jgi:hypothetical protein